MTGTKGYAPRMSTTHLMAEILARPGVARVRPYRPTRQSATYLRVTLENGTYTTFSLADAREWLAADRELDVQAPAETVEDYIARGYTRRAAQYLVRTNAR